MAGERGTLGEAGDVRDPVRAKAEATLAGEPEFWAYAGEGWSGKGDQESSKTDDPKAGEKAGNTHISV